MFQSTPVWCSVSGFLVAYAMLVGLVFRANKHGRRRKWLVLDYIWVPLGALTGVCLVLLWWRMNHL